MQMVVILLIGGEIRDFERVKCDRFIFILNYNFFVFSKDEIDDCFDNMFQVFMGNISFNVFVVLVSVIGL